jgi:hypothetical protein
MDRMNLLGIHAASAAWLATLALPLILVYFLKLRRERFELPSLVLWRQVMNDQRVNAPFQRFRRNLLLALQLLILAFLVCAAMQPYLHSGSERRDRLPVLIDVSASMGGRLEAGGPTRLEVAKRTVGDLIDNLAFDQELCLIAMGHDARRLTGFSDDRGELRQALAGLVVEDVAANPAPALQLAQAMGRSTPFPRALLISDGALPETIDADLAFHLDYVRLPAATTNLGITACSARRRADARWEVFAAVSASAKASGSAVLELRQHGDVLASRPVAPGAGGEERLAFSVDGAIANELELRLVCDGFDALEADNHAFLCLPALHPMRVWVANGLGAWKRALSAQQEVQLVTGQDAELVVSDAPADLDRPAFVHLSDGVIPHDLDSFIQRADRGGSSVVDYHKGDPLLAHVAFEDLIINERISFAPTASDADLEARGCTVMVFGDHGPLLLERQRGATCDYHLLFHSDRSTLPFRLGFPVLAGNLVARTLHLTGQDEVPGIRTGLLPPVRNLPDQAVTVTRPDGSRVEAHADHEGLVGGIGAPHPGIYRVHGSTETATGVSLLDIRTTRLTVVETLHMHEVAVSAGETTLAELSLWKQLAVLALLVALLEWWYANRRPRASGPP